MNWTPVQKYVINAVHSCKSKKELLEKVSERLEEDVSYEALRSAWKRWRADDPTLGNISDHLAHNAGNSSKILSKAKSLEDETLDLEDEDFDPVTYEPPQRSTKKQIHESYEAEWDDHPFKQDKIYKVIVVPDIQVPYEDKLALAAVEQYMADETWDEYINIGDFMDFDCISTFNKTKLRNIEGKTVWQDYQCGNMILDRHQAIILKKNPKARFVLLEGNHEHRIERYIDELPQLRGSLEVEKGLKLKERGFKWVRCYQKGELYKLGKANFTHGLYCAGNHAKTTADKFGVNIFYGHSHDVLTWQKVIFGKDTTIVGQSLGCLCDYEQSYIGKNPTNWQHAFGVFYFHSDGEFTYYVPRIVNQRFIAPNGKVYDGNEAYARGYGRGVKPGK